MTNTMVLMKMLAVRGRGNGRTSVIKCTTGQLQSKGVMTSIRVCGSAIREKTGTENLFKEAMVENVIEFLAVTGRGGL